MEGEKGENWANRNNIINKIKSLKIILKKNKTTQLYYLTLLGVKSLRWVGRAAFFLEALEENLLS